MSFAASPVHASEASSTKQIQCIAHAIYGEARGESRQGQILVGLVIRARVTDSSGNWPDTYCGVVWQKNQFDGVHHPYHSDPRIEQIAREVAAGQHSFPKGWHCVRYFATSNQSFMKEVGRVGGHVFGCRT